MPPSKSSIVRIFFKYDTRLNCSTCQLKVEPIGKGNEIEEENLRLRVCSTVLKGQQASNLEKHVRSRHPKKFKEYIAMKRAVQLGALSSASVLDVSGPSKRAKVANQTLQDEYVPSSTTKSVPMNEQQVIDGIVEMICVSGRPHAILEDSGFLKIMQPIFNAFNLKMNRFNIQDHIHNRFLRVRATLQRLTHNKLLCLKVDCASYMLRSFIGINVQFTHDGGIVIFTLPNIEVPTGDTGQNLEKVIFDELEKFGINQSQIYSITTDSGSNMSKTVKLADEEISEYEIIEGFEYDVDDTEDEVHLNHLDEVNQLAEGILRRWTHWQEDFIIGVQCAAHIIQISVKDSFDNRNSEPGIDECKEVINRSRDVIKELRTQNMMVLIEARNLCKPILDCITSWESTYNMLLTLYQKLQEFCRELQSMNPRLKLTDDDWNLINEIIISFKPCASAAKKLQKEDIVLTDVYRILNICLMDTAEIGTPLANALCENLNQRRSAIFETNTFLACQFLDPRFNFELEESDRKKAIDHLCQIHRKIFDLHNHRNGDTKEDEYSSDSSSVVANGSPDDPEEQSERRYESSLRRKRKAKKFLLLASNASSSEFEAICRTFSPEPLGSRGNVLKWWNEKRITYQELYKVAEVVFSVPATQVSLKRLLSQLNFVCNSLQSKLSSENISEMLVLKSNLMMFEKIEN